ncbi:MAG: alanine racemase [Candidatus Omnitrophota bacterium]|jgi:alanine racemase
MNKNRQIGYRPTWAEINLGNLSKNFFKIKKATLVGTKIMVTVKADAYGHGLIPVSRKLVSCGVDFLGVASIDEGILLRKNGIRIPILVMGAVLKEHMNALFIFHLTPTVCDIAQAVALERKAERLKQPINIHIKVDTGMGRVGVAYYDAEELVKKILKFKLLRVEGLFTHFAFADINKKFTNYQTFLFYHLISKLEALGVHIPLAHAANSAGVLDYNNTHFNMVRPGLAIYGLYLRNNLKNSLKPVLSLKTKVVFIKRVPEGTGISYGHAYVTSRDTKIATLPIGYGDGYQRNLSNLAPVLIRGKRFKVAGRICMDQMMVDVGGLSLKVGDEAVLIGSQGKYEISAEELAELSATIPYEVVCGLSNRIPRVYV